MKRNTKYIPIILSIFLIIFTISFVLEDKTSFECTSTFEEQPMVYITEYGNCYHSVDCHYLRQSKIEKGLYEAKANGYMECSHCHGYSNSFIQVEVIKYYEAMDCTDAIVRSVTRALLITPILYVIVLCMMKQKNTNQ